MVRPGSHITWPLTCWGLIEVHRSDKEDTQPSSQGSLEAGV